MAYADGAMADLNDLRFFAAVVEHGGFSAAARALGAPKSRLSKRVALLEERLGVRLLQRTTRRFAITEVGERFYAHCRAMLEEAQAAQDAVDELRAEPRGIVRASCPISLAQTVLAHVLPEFLAQFPKVQVRSSRATGASTSSTKASTSRSACAPRSIRMRRSCCAASASRACCWRRIRNSSTSTAGPRRPSSWSRLPLLSQYEHDGAQVLELFDANGAKVSVEMRARMICGEFNVLYEAARRGMGVTALPEFVCAPAILRGELEVVLPAWSMPQGMAHFVYPSRRGLLPSVRAFVDFLAERLPETMRIKHEQCMRREDNLA